MERRLRIFESNYGRTGGWSAEMNGRCVATLDYLGPADMFWDNYRVTLVTENSEDSQHLLSSDIWDGRHLRFRNREFGLLVSSAFAAGGRVLIEGNEVRAVMRGLYLPLRGPWPWECLLLWCRGRGVFGRNSPTIR
jgi:hypothetical protein